MEEELPTCKGLLKKVSYHALGSMGGGRALFEVSVKADSSPSACPARERPLHACLHIYIYVYIYI